MDNFLQSREWARFQESLGREVFWLDGILIVGHKLPFGKSYLYLGRAEISSRKFQKLNQLAERKKAIFIRLEPLIKLPTNRFRKAKPHQPERTLVLDLKNREEKLLAEMHPKTRYNLRLAEKHGVTIKQSKDPRDLEIFWQLALKTSRRAKFSYFSHNYYQKMFKILGPLKMISFFTAFYQKKPIASNVILFYQKTATYLFGASDYQFRHLMAPVLLQWAAIKEAKKRKCLFYDFWGIDENKWPGITRFKKSFGGKEIKYPGTFELIYQPFWYRIYTLARRLK